jgi:hypothetical protein
MHLVNTKLNELCYSYGIQSCCSSFALSLSAVSCKHHEMKGARNLYRTQQRFHIVIVCLELLHLDDMNISQQCV